MQARVVVIRASICFSIPRRSLFTIAENDYLIWVILDTGKSVVAYIVPMGQRLDAFVYREL